MNHIPNFIFGDPMVCTYCGCRATEIDHVIPIAGTTNRKRRHADMSKGIRTYACKRCNTKLGCKRFDHFGDRLNFLANYYQELAQEFKRDSEWSDEEIQELDYTLRTYVASNQERMKELDEKVTWKDSIQFRVAIRNLAYVYCLDRMSPKYIEWVSVYFSGYY